MASSQLEALQRRVEEGLLRAERAANDLAIGIGEADQRSKLLRQGTGGSLGCGTIRTTVTRDVDGAYVAGATITVVKAGVIIDSCITNSLGRCSIRIAEAGTYTVTAEHDDYDDVGTSVAATCTTNDVALEFVGACVGTIVVEVTDCETGGPVNAATVTLYDADDFELDSATTGIGGTVTFDIADAVTYKISVAKAGAVTAHVSVNGGCTENLVYVQLGGSVLFSVTGCGCALPGALVVINQTFGGTYTATATTPSSGIVELYLPISPDATFTWTISKALYQNDFNIIGPVTGEDCGFSFDVNLPTQTGYFCYGGNPPFCREAIPPSVTISRVGGLPPMTANYSGVVSTFGYRFTAHENRTSGLSASWSYNYFASGQYYVGSGQGCNTPTAFLQVIGFAGLNQTGGISAGPFALEKVSGTGACPIACICGTGGDAHTISE